MKKTLIKLLSSTIALTLVLASSGAGTAQIDKIKTEDVKADNTVAVVQEVKEEKNENSIIEALKEKMKEEVPVVEVKAEPVAAPVAEAKAEEVAAPEVKVAPAEVAAPEVKVVPAEVVAPEVRVAPAEVAAPEIEAVPVEEVAEPEDAKAEPTATWNISATETDNVAMTFYAEPAADASQVEFDRQSGVVHISGTGAMEENVYRHFLSIEKYLAAEKALFEAEYEVEVRLEYDETITDVLELDKNVFCYSAETGERLVVTENMRENLDPAEFLEYSPEAIYIDDGITNVSDNAFLCCAGLKEVVLPSTIESVGIGAFGFCRNLTTVVLPENAEIKEGAFAFCYNLKTVELRSMEAYNGFTAQSEENIAPVKTLTAEEINVLINEG